MKHCVDSTNSSCSGDLVAGEQAAAQTQTMEYGNTMSLRSVVESCSSLTNARLVHLILGSYRLKSHLRLLKKFLLHGQVRSILVLCTWGLHCFASMGIVLASVDGLHACVDGNMSMSHWRYNFQGPWQVNMDIRPGNTVYIAGGVTQFYSVRISLLPYAIRGVNILLLAPG